MTVSNEIGASIESDETLFPPAMQVVPYIPANPPLRVTGPTRTTTMVVSYEPLTGLSTGGSPILSYFLEVDLTGVGNPGSPWTEVKGFTIPTLDLQ